MLLARKTSVILTNKQSNIIGHMCYAAYKLWNVCNYERLNYKELNLPCDYPNWYFQKKYHKDDLWYKQLPSQTAQEVCKQLDKSWKSFYSLLKSKSNNVVNPKPPKYKSDNIAITYMQNAISHKVNEDIIRLSLSKRLKEYMYLNYGIKDNYLYLENKFFKDFDVIKQIKIYPPINGKSNIIVIYEIKDIDYRVGNNSYLSIDLGLHNLFSCFNSNTHESFIAGRKYLTICHKYNKEISRVQSQYSSIQNAKGIKSSKGSKHISNLFVKKNNCINDYLHKTTRAIVNYCVVNNINTVIIGDIKGIRKDNNIGHVNNQKLHSLPYNKIYQMLEYKLRLEGIRLIKQKESYSSQTSPIAPFVNKEYAKKSNRIKRGLYKDGDNMWNADIVGAYNILRLYLQEENRVINLNPYEIKSPYLLKVAV